MDAGSLVGREKLEVLMRVLLVLLVLLSSAYAQNYVSLGGERKVDAGFVTTNKDKSADERTVTFFYNGAGSGQTKYKVKYTSEEMIPFCADFVSDNFFPDGFFIYYGPGRFNRFGYNYFYGPYYGYSFNRSMRCVRYEMKPVNVQRTLKIVIDEKILEMMFIDAPMFKLRFSTDSKGRTAYELVDSNYLKADKKSRRKLKLSVIEDVQ